LEDLTTKVQGGRIQIFVHERGLRAPVPMERLSDGTLHYLILLAILCHPEPPPLICLEEPELGLHPDVIPKVAELLVESAQRTQLIVTTHSDALVSALSDIPESVVVCERGDEGTSLTRLEPERLREWLVRYQLGELWSMGEIGGNRW
jgi:predicted ATPase